MVRRWVMPKIRILVADDENSIQRFVSACLREQGYEVMLASDGELALQAVEEVPPDLVILDIMMPKVDGFEICRRVREWSQVPIIVLSARLDEQDRVRCLRLGADDYLVKPFGIDELIARVEAVLRRTTAQIFPDPPPFSSGDFRMDFGDRRVTVADQVVRLTPTEYNLLRQLVLHRGRLLTHRNLLNLVWGSQYGNERQYVRVFVNRLRKALGDKPASPKYIETLPGVGYRFLASS